MTQTNVELPIAAPPQGRASAPNLEADLQRLSKQRSELMVSGTEADRKQIPAIDAAIKAASLRLGAADRRIERLAGGLRACFPISRSPINAMASKEMASQSIPSRSARTPCRGK